MGLGLTINHNLMAMTAARNLGLTYSQLATSVNRLSSGLRITSSKDDAAGLAVRELFRSDVAVLNQGIRNANDAISMLQTMDGAAQVIDEKLIRMKELAEQAATGTYSSTQRAIMNDEFAAMRDEIERIAQATDFAGIKMLNTTSGGVVAVLGVTEDDATLSGGTQVVVTAFSNWNSGDSITLNWTDSTGTGGSANFTIANSAATVNALAASINAIAGLDGTVAWVSGTGFVLTGSAAGASQIDMVMTDGIGGTYDFDTSIGGTAGVDGQLKIHFGTGNESAEDYYYAEKQDMTSSGLGIDALSIATQAGAQAALTTIDTAIASKDTARAHFGATMNRLENTVSNLSIQAENIQAAEAQISDADIALEMTAFVNNQIKAQAAVAMLAQANMIPQMALTLLGG
ncbi:MAG: hypothetical protein IMF10_08995 [Proteobacteria bacterium]|nr:hypothetical protein [Pseudomonadota bacterium]